jgi:hydroxymethylbilane synthase
MQPPVKIGTRDSELAMWQANQVWNLLTREKIESELVFIKSEGDLDTVKPLYELGVQGIFTKALDAALLDNRIDIAVHSMKDVPTKLADGIRQAAVLKRGSFKDIIVYKNSPEFLEDKNGKAVIATSSIRRSAQWLHRYPNHTIENLRGNVNTRLRKVSTNEWDGAIFAAAGLERINLRPENSEDLDWMLPAPAQGAIVIVCRENDLDIYNCCRAFNDEDAERCTFIERSFLRELQGGCTTPISALALIENDNIIFKGSICSNDGKIKIDVQKEFRVSEYERAGMEAASELLKDDKVNGILQLKIDAGK